MRLDEFLVGDGMQWFKEPKTGEMTRFVREGVHSHHMCLFAIPGSFFIPAKRQLRRDTSNLSKVMNQVLGLTSFDIHSPFAEYLSNKFATEAWYRFFTPPDPSYLPIAACARDDSFAAASWGSMPVSIKDFIRIRSSSIAVFGSLPKSQATACPTTPAGGV